MQRTGYSNPAKLMNYIRMQKQKNNTNKNFENVGHYASHIEAFSQLSNKRSEEEREH